MSLKYTHAQWNGKKVIIGHSQVDTAQPVHLLVGFHGADSTPENILVHGNRLKIRNAIVAYPEGPVDAENGLWSWWRDGPNQKTTVAAFADHTSKVLDEAYHYVSAAFSKPPVVRTSFWGFSQGGAAALVYALLGTHPLHKIASVCGFLPEFSPPSSNGASAEILGIYGLNDDVVPPFLAEFALDEMKARGHRLTVKETPQGHELNADNLQDINAFFDF